MYIIAHFGARYLEAGACAKISTKLTSLKEIENHSECVLRL